MTDPEQRFYAGAPGPAGTGGASGTSGAFGAASSPAGLPLARYLPPLPPGMAAAWLAEHVPPGSWLLDPLGASPALALEAAQAGYRVLVASNNPILSFLTETLARAPGSADFQSALAELAVARRGEERLEHHILHLYLTACDSCGEEIPAQAFLWRKGEDQPFARIYDCPKCGQSGEHPVTPADLERLKAMGGDKLQRARALQRVILNEDEHRADVEQALENYLPRPLYALFTLANKLEGLGLPPDKTRLLQALLISIFDQGNTLWPWPGGRSRPKQLTVPPQFREHNLWWALEDAAREWAAAFGGPAVPVTRWPELPPRGAGGICLFRGRVKALMPLPEELTPRAILTVFPRPNQAFWTLSVLWSGWLWGAEAALPLRNVLERRRFDWNWHTSAIHNALSAVSWSVPPETPFFGLVPELAPGFLSAVILAAEGAGFHLDGMAMRNEQELAQALWRPVSSPAAREHPQDKAEPAPPTAPSPAPPLAGELESAAREAIRADLLARNEPAPYLTEYAAGLVALARRGAIPRNLSSIPGDLLTRVQAVLARTFADRSLFKLYGGPAEEERGAWWLANHPTQEETDLPLADRVEMEVVRFMQKQPTFPYEELDQQVCEKFPGLLTPPAGLVRACLESYGEPLAPQPGPAKPSGMPQPGGGPSTTGGPQTAAPRTWRMRASESAATRKNDLREVRALLETAGQAFGYAISERRGALVWEQENAEPWWFYPMASSIISRYVLAVPASGKHVLVLPGSRARLVSYKLHRDPRLEEALQSAGRWRFLKFRHLRDIAARPDLPTLNWEALLDEDPLTEEATQMHLFAG